MKKVIVIVSVLVIVSANFVFGGQVDTNVAQNVGKTFLTQKISSPIHKNTGLDCVYSVVSNRKGAEPLTYFYVFNLDSTGFVIVSGIDNVMPILAYSTEGIFDPSNIPPSMETVLNRYKTEISYVVENEITATQQVKKQWNDLISGKTPIRKANIASVEPLLRGINWNQGPIYNDSCPYDSKAIPSYNYKCPAGCVATAMAMIIKYWEYPTQGFGSKCYNANFAHWGYGNYGQQCANFGNTTYDYTLMPNKISSNSSLAEKQAVAQLSYHCGVAANMMYGPNGSGANMGNAQDALIYYFGYSQAELVYKYFYTDEEWIDMLKDQINNEQPILCSGSDVSAGAGHAFVCDGYDEDNYFHFNWGWGGAYNCYCKVDSLIPGGVGMGGGNGNYSQNQNAIINIKVDKGITPIEITIDTSACERFTYKGFTYTESDVYTRRIFSSSGDTIITINLTILATPAKIEKIYGDPAPAVGTHTYFVNSVLNADDYQWEISNSNWTISGTGTSIQLNIPDPSLGVLSVRANNVNGCYSESSLSISTCLSLGGIGRIRGNDKVSEPGIYTYSVDTVANAVLYQWELINADWGVVGSANENAVSFYINSKASATLSLSIFDNCDRVSTKLYTIQSTAEGDTVVNISKYENDNYIRISPNPTSGKIVVSGQLLDVNAEIYDIVGKLQESRISKIEKSEIVLDISHLSAGLYFLKVDGKTVKIIKN